MSDLLESSDEELNEWLEEIKMKPILKKRLLRHLIKLKGIQGGAGVGSPTSPQPPLSGDPPTRTESLGSPAGTNNSNNRVKHGEWKKGEKIGQGAFGLVFKGLNTLNGEIIAIKELNYDADKAKQLKEMIKEVKLMRRLSHVSDHITSVMDISASQVSLSLNCFHSKNNNVCSWVSPISLLI